MLFWVKCIRNAFQINTLLVPRLPRDSVYASYLAQAVSCHVQSVLELLKDYHRKCKCVVTQVPMNGVTMLTFSLCPDCFDTGRASITGLISNAGWHNWHLSNVTSGNILLGHNCCVSWYNTGTSGLCFPLLGIVCNKVFFWHDAYLKGDECVAIQIILLPLKLSQIAVHNTKSTRRGKQNSLLTVFEFFDTVSLCLRKEMSAAPKSGQKTDKDQEI